MKAWSALIVLIFLSLAGSAGYATNDWVQLKFKNGHSVGGYVVKVTEENVHLVSSSINRLIPKDDLTDESQQHIAETFAVTITPKPDTKKTTTRLKQELPSQRSHQLYEQVSDIYSPRSSYPYRSLYHHPYRYYLPYGYSIAYPVYRHHYRSHYSAPRWTINIDL